MGAARGQLHGARVVSRSQGERPRESFRRGGHLPVQQRPQQDHARRGFQDGVCGGPERADDGCEGGGWLPGFASQAPLVDGAEERSTTVVVICHVLMYT